MWLRYVLVPGITDDLSDVEKLARYAAGLGNVQRVDVLPFHQIGRYKWEELGLDYTLADVEPPEAVVTDAVRAVFRANGFATYTY